MAPPKVQHGKVPSDMKFTDTLDQFLREKKSLIFKEVLEHSETGCAMHALQIQLYQEAKS